MSQKLTLWCSNNWRMGQGVARKTNNFRPKRTEIVWRTRQEDVMDEIAKILNVEEATTQTPGWFTVRTAAIKNVIAKMTPEELRELDMQVEETAKIGNNEEQKKR
jgi:hypothetical protein